MTGLLIMIIRTSQALVIINQFPAPLNHNNHNRDMWVAVIYNYHDRQGRPFFLNNDLLVSQETLLGGRT